MYLPTLNRGNLVVAYIVMIFLCCCVFARTAISEESDRAKLNELQKKINSLQKELEHDNLQKNKAVAELKLTEKAIAQSASRLYSIEQQLNESQKKLGGLTAQQQELSHQLIKNHDYIVEQTRTAYALGNQEYLKLLLNQQDPSKVARMVVYYQYFNRSRTNRFVEIKNDMRQITDLEKNIHLQTANLTQLKQNALQDKKELDSNREQRKQLVASLSADLKQKDNALQSMLRDEQHLKKLLNQLQEIDDVQLDLAPPKEFSQLKGKLPWPTEGKLIANFGANREQTGKVKWRGTVIQTRPGQEVRAIAYGRVVFADWLRGFGMLLIVDHGKGYMSLYGQNEQLYKKLGDWVNANDVIATTGNSGGHNAISLYFEIRHNGIPVNPANWCKSIPGVS